MEKKVIIIIGSIILSIGLLLLVILLPISYSVVQLNEYALYRSTWSEELRYDSDYAINGRHFTGINGKLIKFPSVKSLIQFKEGYDGKPDGILKGGGNDLQSWSKEGSNVYIEASYYFSLNKEKLIDMYVEYGDDWQSFILMLSFSVLKATTVEFNTTSFITDSKTISTRMEDNLRSAFKSNFSEAVILDSFQLQKISFDSTLDNAINAKLIQAHRKKSYEYEKSILTTKKQTERNVTLINNQINQKIASDGDALAIGYDYTQLSEKLGYLVDNMTTQYAIMKTNTAASTADIWKLFYISELKLMTNIDQITLLDNSVTKTVPAN